MKNGELVKQHYDLGHKYMSKGEYENAWKNFDKAINFGGKNPILLDCKAAAMGKIPEWRQHALQVTNDMITKWPKDFKGYYRRSSILFAIKTYDQALACIAKAIELGPTQAQNERQFRAIQELRAAITIDKVQADRIRAENDIEEAKRQAKAKIASRKARINYTHLLSRDIVLTIVEHGMTDHPGFIFRVAGVCKSWRNMILYQPSLWSILVLGKKRPDKKIETYIERSNGRIKELKITAHMDRLRADEIAQALLPYISDVKSLWISAMYATFWKFKKRWEGRFRELESLRIDLTEWGQGVNSLDHGLVFPGSTSLKNLRVSGGEYVLESSSNSQLRCRAKMVSVKTLQISSACIYLPFRHQDQGSFFFACFPESDVIDLVNVAFSEMFASNSSGLADEGLRSSVGSLPKLHSLRLDPPPPFVSHMITTMDLPALQDLELPSFPRPIDQLFNHFESDSLMCRFGGLRSLDISGTSCGDKDLLTHLPSLQALQFLNVSSCPLSNTFLEGIARKTGDRVGETILPNLKALSIANNHDITGGPLLKFVSSRTPGWSARTNASSQSSLGSSSQIQTKAQRKGLSSAFKPSTKPSFGRPTKPPPKPKPSQTPDSSAVVALPPPTQIASSDHLPSIAWLNIDHCERIEPAATTHLRKFVRFVSNVYSPMPEKSRINGKGRWKWDADLSKYCGNGEGGCGLRRSQGTKDQWYVHHTCEPEVPEEKRGWTKVRFDEMLGTPVSP